MSGAALGWAFKQPIPMSAAKFVLVYLADQTTSDLAFAAANTIATATALDRKTVLASIARLVEWGLMEDTGERRGKTGQIPVYRLLMNEGLFDVGPFEKSPKNGTIPKTVPVPKTDSKSPNFPGKESQKRDTDLKHIQELDPTHTPGAREDGPEPPGPSPGALATRAMIAAGMPLSYVNPSAPKLLNALAEGVTYQELADVTRQLASRGTGPPTMNFVIATALGRRRDAAAQQQETRHDNAATHQNRNASGRSSGARPSALQRVVAGLMATGDTAGPAADADDPVG